MSTSTNTPVLDDAPFSTTNFKIKTELEEHMLEETECLFLQDTEEVDCRCGMNCNNLCTGLHVNEDNDPLRLDTNCTSEELMIVKHEDCDRIIKEESEMDCNKLYTSSLPLKNEDDPLDIDSNCNNIELVLVKNEDCYNIEQENSDDCVKITDDPVLKNVECNIDISKCMICNKRNKGDDHICDHVIMYKLINNNEIIYNNKMLQFKDETQNMNDNSVKCKVIQHNEQHVSDSRKYKCKYCEKTFKWRSNLTYHNNFHTGKKSYTCMFCHKSFNQSSDLKRHVFIHTGEKKFSCDICQKSFNDSGNLKRHRSVHIKGNKYTCNICLKSFNQGGSLKTHLFTHTGEEKYVCNFCEKPFNRSGSLKRHISVHTGEKRFTCNVCLKSFNQSCHLKIHLTIHSREKKFTCNFCQKSFNRKDGLKRHIVSHRNE
ncbi:uncharacterized protein LOC142333769 isoform X2 [Lycorma delicatula]